jgi:signal transduction histidine kinase
MKYSPPSGIVRVRCCQSTKGNFARFSVSDDGPGMTKENLAKLFGLFSQVNAADGTMRAGSGLGLAISKALIEAHGGRIAVESAPKKGTICWFEVPISATSSATALQTEGNVSH